MNNNPNEKRALVIGGSMAGMLAARVLSEHYDEVLVVDKDDFPDKPGNRPGTPQAYHPHRLLPRGKLILESLFPGWQDDLLAQGAFAKEGKRIRSVSVYGTMEVIDRKDAGASRALLEWVIRHRLQAISNVRFVHGQEATGLLMDSGGTKVTGVTIRERGKTTQPATIEADLVLDASGRSSKLVKWLQALGYLVPEPECLKASLGYSTRYYRIPPHVAEQWSVIVTESVPAKGIGTAVFGPVEHDTAEVVLYYAGGKRYPTTDAGLYEQELAALLDPSIAELLQACEPLGPPRGYRVPECFRQRFERMERWPSGLLVMGDALCNFDPIYGQGITVAAIEAELLAAQLHERRTRPQPFFEREAIRRMQEAIDPAWWLTVVADLCWPGVEYTGSHSREGIAFAQNYFELYRKQAVGKPDMELFGKYMMMNGLLLSPRALLNAEAVRAVLAADATGEGERLLAEIAMKDRDHQLEQFLERTIPAGSYK
ncbi:FAD-dependent oxidoreductase [Paenibacillus ehimensis]|uniref:FAD dependent oxidoreductase n=1 Tax=Paenibacillus ehimensis TaxID=79264 RepID=A0ABT8VIU5_9BACL|nr:FAD dependent oxidoreductase [Paenibacillus ehimensis]MDO3680902.1 FAD dependent oxidoreductase [Paenibacillus ehimensis]